MYRNPLKPTFLALSLLPLSNIGYAVDESRLWLPKSHERTYLDLKYSAEAAENLKRCVKVLRGTIDLEQSTKDRPIFRIQCRQENGRTYNEMVDGLTKQTLTTVEIDENQDEERLENQKIRFWQQCRALFNEKTKLFLNLSVLNEDPEPEEFSMERALYRIRFDADDMDGNALKYYAICTVADAKDAKLHVRKRHDEQ